MPNWSNNIIPNLSFLWKPRKDKKSCRGKSEGLPLMRMINSNLEILSYSQRHIEAIVKHSDSVSWHFSGLYGFPNQAQRERFWDLLRILRDRSSLPWLCCGDFMNLCLMRRS